MFESCCLVVWPGVHISCPETANGNTYLEDFDALASICCSLALGGRRGGTPAIRIDLKYAGGSGFSVGPHKLSSCC